MRALENERVTAPAVPGGDGIMVRGGDGKTIVRRCLVDFSGVSLEGTDEAASFVQGAHARVVQCRFTGAGKLVLCGSGDTPELDAGAHVIFEECMISARVSPAWTPALAAGLPKPRTACVSHCTAAS